MNTTVNHLSIGFARWSRLGSFAPLLSNRGMLSFIWISSRLQSVEHPPCYSSRVGLVHFTQTIYREFCNLRYLHKHTTGIMNGAFTATVAGCSVLLSSMTSKCRSEQSPSLSYQERFGIRIPGFICTITIWKPVARSLDTEITSGRTRVG